MAKKKKRKKETPKVENTALKALVNPVNPPLVQFLIVLGLHALIFDKASLDPSAPKEIVLAVSLVLWGFVMIALYQGGRKLTFGGMDWALLATLLATASIEYIGDTAGCGPLWPTLLILFSLYLMARTLFSTFDTMTICRYLGVFGGVVALLNLLLHFFYPLDWHNTVTVAGATVDAKAPGLVGTFSNPNYLAGFLLLSLPLLVGLFAKGSQAAPGEEPSLLEDRVFLGMALLFIFIALAMAWCRSVWLVAVIAVPTAIVIGRRGRDLIHSKKARREQERWDRTWPRVLALALVTILPLAALGFAAGGGWKLLSTSTLAKRMRIAAVAVTELKDKPIKGWGAGRFERVYASHRPANWRETKYPVSTKYTHNVLIQAWGALGAFGLLLLLYVSLRLISALGEGLWTRRLPEEEQELVEHRRGRGLLALAAIAFLMDNLFNVTLFVSSTTVLFVVFVAALAATKKHGQLTTLDENAAYRGKVMVGLAIVCLVSIFPRLYENWQINKMMSEARHGCPPERLSELRKATKKRPHWIRFAYDVAGRLAKAKRFEESLDLYEKVDARVPGYQEVRTNIAIIKRILSQRRF